VTRLAAWLEEVEARAAKATPGPWFVGKGTVYHKRARPEGEEPLEIEVAATEGTFWDEDPDDTAFIAHARADVPALVALLRASLAVVDASRHYIRKSIEHGDALARFDAAVAARAQPAPEDPPK